VQLAQSRGGACFCTRGAMQGYAVVLYSRVGKNRDTRRGSPTGAGAGRTANHLAILFSQKVLAVRSANCIYRPVGGRYLVSLNNKDKTRSLCFAPVDCLRALIHLPSIIMALS